MRRIRDCEWAIMSASAWISGRPSIEKIIKENNTKTKFTIVVAIRKDETYGSKEIPIFILGSGDGYGNAGENKTFVKDTGKGYGLGGKCTIENCIEVEDGKIISEGNGIGFDEKRPLWVFK